MKVSRQDDDPVTSMCFRMIVRPRCGPSSSSGFSFNDHFCDDPFDAGDDPTDDDPAGDDPTDDPAADDDGDHNCYYDYYDS